MSSESVNSQKAPDETPRGHAARSPTRRRIVLAGMLALVLSPIIFMTAFVIPGPLQENRTVIVPHGSSIREIAALLDANGAIYNSYLFLAAAKIIAYDNLKSGEYELTPAESMASIVLMMHDGRSVLHWFTLTEGMTSAETHRLLNVSNILTGDSGTPPAEGSMLPETYRYSYGDNRAALIARMQKAMQDTLNELWPKREPGLPLKTPDEAVILASIVEKETGKAEERARIAGVFYNRLRQSMRLQSDPTVIYAVEKARGLMERPLTRDDLLFASPYNTYASDGLPPEPICNPGRAALEAVLHPEANDYLYFVADGTGGHVFAKGLAEHNKNVARWRKM
ncbi:MAG: endolytic transglycosylase MltG [Alphaproteobacteria bacterium]|nr:endolytic transglycosylase MltG [Alphaproteobacteria bacterium]